MENSQKRFSIKPIDVKIAFSVALSMLVCQLIPGVQMLSACTAALMCCQDDGKVSIKTGVTRVIGVAVCGIIAVLIVLVDNAIGNDYVRDILMAVALIASFVVLRALKFEPIPSRVACVTIILVLVVLTGDARITYALKRLVATTVGAIVGFAVSYISNLIFKNKETASK
jgi:uncharacterized membrane protein YgaE (UPF0421/DUF939 family)